MGEEKKCINKSFEEPYVYEQSVAGGVYADSVHRKSFISFKVFSFFYRRNEK